MKRVLRLTAAAVLAIGGGVVLSPAASADAGCQDSDGYGAGGVCGMSAQVDPACDAAVPTLAYSTDGATGETVTVTFVNPDGADAVYADQPLAGSVPWPTFDWAMADVQVTIADGTVASTVVDYPVGCAPAELTSNALTGALTETGVLAETGATATPLAGIAAGLLVLGTGVLLVSRRRGDVRI